MPKPLPKELTSYDLLKALAVILMITDHFGYFFYHDEMWFRVFGRLCVPIWFFLIGHAETTKIPKTWWLGGLIVALSALVAGQYLLPLNILFTMMVLRYLRGAVVVRAVYSVESLRGMFFILLLLTIPTAIIFEYGAIAMMFVLLGFIVRHREHLYTVVDHKYLKMFTVAAFLCFFIMQGVSLPSATASQALVMMAGFVLVAYMLWNFKPVAFSDADQYMAPSFIKLFQFMGRRTLEIYVVHLVIFRGIALYIYPDQYKFFDWAYVPHASISIFL